MIDSHCYPSKLTHLHRLTHSKTNDTKIKGHIAKAYLTMIAIDFFFSKVQKYVIFLLVHFLITQSIEKRYFVYYNFYKQTFFIFFYSTDEPTNFAITQSMENVILSVTISILIHFVITQPVEKIQFTTIIVTTVQTFLFQKRKVHQKITDYY